MKKNIIVIEQLQIAPKDTATFTEFYHHEYLPEVLGLEEVLCINRYEEHGTKGSLAWFEKSFLTIYNLSPDLDSIDEFEDILQSLSIGVQRKMDEFKFNFFFRDVYNLIFSHKENSSDNYFANGPFFVVTVETQGEDNDNFHQWYEKVYLPKTMADIPTWSDCKRYQSISRTPTHYHTIYKAANINDLERGFELLRAPYRYQSNADWDSWVGKTISKQNATSFQQIYHRSK